MRDEFAEYREYLREGLRIEVGIPLAGGGVFRDWAIVQAANQDEIVAQVSRDLLPLDVKVEPGTILDVSVWKNKDVYSCSSMVIDRVSARRLRIRLFGSFTLRERRQFFRIDLDLRVTYSKLETGTKEDAQVDWERRLELERMKFQGYDTFMIAAQMAKFRPVVPVEWQEVPWQSLNLGGGGMRLRLPERLHEDSLVNLEVQIPLDPPRTVHTVATVIHTMEPRTVRDGRTYHATGLQFVFLDERDRDFIFQHISARQIEFLRERASSRARSEGYKERVPGKATPLQYAMRIVWAILFIVISVAIVRYFIRYQAAQPPNEIGKTYEKALREYRKMAPPGQ